MSYCKSREILIVVKKIYKISCCSKMYFYKNGFIFLLYCGTPYPVKFYNYPKVLD